MDYKLLMNEKNAIMDERTRAISDLKKANDSQRKLAVLMGNIDSILDETEYEFERVTQLDKTDITFLFFATALQCIRQYYFTDFKEPLNDQEAAKNTPGHIQEHSDRGGQLYHPSLYQIISNPVPYDAMIGGGLFNLGLGGTNHRQKTLGHDPVYGWIFGTMNILTSTLTNIKFQSYHIRTENSRDAIKMNAKMPLIVGHSANRLINEGVDGKQCVAAALAKQYIHLCSDYPTAKSLPIPIVATLSESAATELAERGINLGSVATVGKQALGASLINCIIATLHNFCFDPSTISQQLYEVKTRKILSYSNAIATSSNLIYVSVSACCGNANGLRKLDVGGLLITINRLITDQKFILQIEEEFLRKKMYSIIMDC